MNVNLWQGFTDPSSYTNIDRGVTQSQPHHVLPFHAQSIDHSRAPVVPSLRSNTYTPISIAQPQQTFFTPLGGTMWSQNTSSQLLPVQTSLYTRPKEPIKSFPAVPRQPAPCPRQIGCLQVQDQAPEAQYRDLQAQHNDPQIPTRMANPSTGIASPSHRSPSDLHPLFLISGAERRLIEVVRSPRKQEAQSLSVWECMNSSDHEYVLLASSQLSR